jgi:hypothetical protein
VTEQTTTMRARSRLLIALCVGLASMCAAPTVAFAQFRLPLYEPIAAVPVVCETIDEWAADPLARQLADEAAYTSLDGADRIVLAPPTCVGLLLLAADPSGKHDALNERPGFSVAWSEAQAALALAHEVAHAALRGHDETAAACFARVHAADALSVARVPPARLSVLMAHIAEADRLLPPAYHAHPC